MIRTPARRGRADADDSRVRHDAVFDTGAADGRSDATAILGSADGADTIIGNVFAAAAPGSSDGISATRPGIRSAAVSVAG